MFCQWQYPIIILWLSHIPVHVPACVWHVAYWQTLRLFAGHWLILRRAHGCTRLCKSVFLFSLNEQSEVELLDCMAVVVLGFFRELHALFPHWLPQGSFAPVADEASLCRTARPTKACSSVFAVTARLAGVRAWGREGVRGWLPALVMCFSLMTSDVGHLLMCPLAAGEWPSEGLQSGGGWRPWALGLSLLSRRTGSWGRALWPVFWP